MNADQILQRLKDGNAKYVADQENTRFKTILVV